MADAMGLSIYMDEAGEKAPPKTVDNVDDLLQQLGHVPAPPLKPRKAGSSSSSEILEDDDGDQYEGDEDDDDDGDDETRSRASTRRSVPRHRTREEEESAKREVLYELGRLEKKGALLPRRYTIQSSYAEMRADLDRVKRDRAIDAFILQGRGYVVMTASGIENLNSLAESWGWVPKGFNLSGWSENVHQNISNFDDLLEEVAIKYGCESSLPVEIRIAWTLFMSAMMFHLGKMKFAGVELGSLMKDNPALTNELFKATTSRMAPADILSSFMAPPTAVPKPVGRMQGPGNFEDILSSINHEEPGAAGYPGRSPYPMPPPPHVPVYVQAKPRPAAPPTPRAFNEDSDVDSTSGDSIVSFGSSVKPNTRKERAKIVNL